MEGVFDFLITSFNTFYRDLNDVGKLVFFIAIILLLILIVLIIIMFIQKTMAVRQIKLLQKNEKNLELKKDIETVDTTDIDLKNEKTRDLRNIVEELKRVSEEKKDTTDLYEDEQEKTAIISYKELLKAANGEKSDEPIIKKIEINDIPTEKPKRQEIFSSVFTPNEQPIYKESKEEMKLAYSDNDSFLNSLKEFRNNL
jgi:biopolymer transport protein ExbD